MTTTAWSVSEAAHYMHTFKRLPLCLERGQGVYVWDVEGKRYMDWVAGIAVNVLGYDHPAVVEAICEQAKKLIHTSNLYYTLPQLELADLLIKNSCAERLFFGNSGAEANEGAIKLARKWGKLHRKGAYEVITALDSFHGRTLAMVAATGQPKYQEPYAPMPAGFVNVPFNDLAAIKGATTAATVAVMLEPVQGESGVHPADPDYLQGVREWCDQQGLLLIFDEIQTGMGRTGHFLGYEWYKIEPDVFTMAKGLAGGVPIGAFLAKGSAAEALGPGDHGSTFGGSPLACAAGVATVKTVLEQELPANAGKQGGYLAAKLAELRQAFPIITEIRARGLMIAFDLAQDLAPTLVLKGLGEGLILNATGPRTVRIVPPLILTRREVDEGISLLRQALAGLAEA
ncbi:MAG TPA: aspartate aminotransferase family protein [Chloroflexota bacterium]|jgi:acetylornithine aminotransferase/acetylornithine/N-succinyldiaminopimelate aminotransferase|nr:aspartate aminotransferase family protein [Chloroflexota bacterium]